MVALILTPEHLVDALRGFVEMQKLLVKAISTQAPRSNSGRRRIIDELGGEWSVHLHGVGATFKHVSLGYIVDIHNHMNQPQQFDTWRVEEFFGSLSAGTQRRYRKEIGSQTVDQYLNGLVSNGVLSLKAPGIFLFGENA